MFIERLSKKEVKRFVAKKLTDNLNRVIVKRDSSENAWKIAYRIGGGPEYLLRDNDVVPFNKKLQAAWQEYLQTVFGEEYKRCLKL